MTCKIINAAERFKRNTVTWDIIASAQSLWMESERAKRKTVYKTLTYAERLQHRADAAAQRAEVYLQEGYTELCADELTRRDAFLEALVLFNRYGAE